MAIPRITDLGIDDIRTLERLRPYSVIVEKRGESAVAVDSYGRIVAGPSTDHAAVIKAAVDAAPPGGAIFLKAGTYLFARDVRIDSKPVAIVGEKGGTTVKAAPGATLTDFFVVVGVSARFEGITFDATGATVNFGIYFYAPVDTEDWIVEDCAFVNIGKSGTDGAIRALAYTATGAVTAKRLAIRNVKVRGGWRGLSIEGSGSSLIVGVDIESCDLEGGSDTGIVLWGCREVRVRGCRVKGYAGHGIALTYVVDFAVENCVALNNGYAGIVASLGCQNGSIVNCIAGSNGWHGIDVDTTTEGGQAADAHVTVAGCVAYGSVQYHGIYVQGARYVTISGCIARNNKQQGICISNSFHVVVSGCRAFNNAGSGVYIGDNADYVAVVANDLRGNTASSIRPGAGANNYVTANAT